MAADSYRPGGAGVETPALKYGHLQALRAKQVGFLAFSFPGGWGKPIIHGHNQKLM